MQKILLTYFSFAIACVVVIAAFITATTYVQLAVATLLYPALIFFAFKVLPLKTWMNASKKPVVRPQPASGTEQIVRAPKTNPGISDLDKRAFLKLIGATGLSFFLISIFGRRIEALLFGQNLVQIPTSVGSPSAGKNNTPAASPTEEYKISEIDDNIIGYYGFIKADG